jgi:hypothetical protein
MLDKVKKIKSLLINNPSGQSSDFKCFIRTNKNMKKDKKPQSDQHITNFGI